MTVDITQEEMNILNLNGLSTEDVKDNVQYLRMTGLNDEDIRNQYSDLLTELRPITILSDDDTKNIQEWNQKPPITPYEKIQREVNRLSVEFDGTYDNIDNKANLNKFEKVLDVWNTKRENKYQKEKEERAKKIDEGTANFWDNLQYQRDKNLEKLDDLRKNPEKYKNENEQNSERPALREDVYLNLAPNSHRNSDEKIGFAERLERNYASLSWLPVVGGFFGEGDTKKEKEIREHIIKGEPIRQDELDFLNRRLKERNEDAVRGFTIGSEIGANLLTSLVRFGGEMAMGNYVLKSLGLLPKAAESANLTQKVKNGLKTMGLFGAANTLNPATSTNEIYSLYQQKMSNNTIEVTPTGTYIFKLSEEKPASAFLKSMAEVFIMFASEGSGELIGLPIQGVKGAASKYVANPVFQYLKSNKKLVDFVKKTMPALSKQYEKMHNLPQTGKTMDWLKSTVKYDGFIEECGEEVVEDILNLTAGTRNEERTKENYAKAIFKSPDEWAVIGGMVLLQGGILSVTSNLIGNQLEKNGASDDEIIESLQNLSIEEQKKIIDTMQETGIIDVKPVQSDEEIRIENEAEQVKDMAFKMMTEQGFDEEYANAQSEIIKARSKVGQKWNEGSPVKWFNSLGLELINRKNTDNQEVLKGNVVYNQDNISVAGANENEYEDAAKEWQEKGTDSKYFKGWFGNSKVVDENGKPLVVYHGTNADFDKFEIGDLGYHFGNYEQATERMTDFTDGNPHILSGYIKMENPLDIVSDVGDWLDVDTVKEYLHEYEVLNDEEFKNVNTLSQITSLLQSKGYDGIIYENQFEGKGKSYIVFNSSQFKSMDNKGTFDESNPNIYYQDEINKYNDRIEKLNEKLKELNLNNKNEYDKIEEFYEISKNKLLEQKREELEKQGLNEKDIKEKLNSIAGDSKFQSDVKENSKYSEWADNVEVYVYDYADLLAEYCEDKGYIVDVVKSNQSISTYLKLYETNEQFENNEPVKEIRISDHKNRYGDKDIMLHYSTPINDAIKAIDENINNILSEEFKNNFKGFIFNKDKIVKDLDFTGLDVRNQRNRIINYYNKYFQTDGKSKSNITKNITKNGIGKLIFSRKIRDRLANKSSYILAQIFMSNPQELINLGEIIDVSENEKNIVTPLIIEGHNSIFSLVFTIKKYNRGYTVSDIEIKNVNQYTKGQRPQTSADKSIINDVNNNINPNVNNHEDNNTTKYNQGNDENEINDFTENVFGYKKVRINNKEEYDNFVDEFHSSEKRASITFENSALNEPKAIIELFENADKSSFMHELGHLFLEDVIKASKTNKDAATELKYINEYLGHKGGEYTRQEHEKFAKGFEIYLMSGRAPNAQLRGVFDTFKDWLREIYHFVLSSGGALSKDVYSVYDLLFKDYNPSDTEVIKNILRSARAASNNVAEGKRTLNSEQRKFKEVAYDILAYGLNKNKSYLKKVLEGDIKKHQKEYERIENAIANIDDAYSSRDGMLPEWKEYFSDPGVSYENSDTGADYELARAAFEVIRDKKYLDYDSNNPSNTIDSAMFEKLNASYKFILDLFEKSTGKEKDYALSAMYDWLEQALPDELYQEIFTEMFIHDSEEIERHQNMSKFDIAKEKIIENSQLLYYNEHSKFTDMVKSVLNSLNFLTANDKTKIFNNMLQYKNAQELINDIDNIMDIAQVMDSQNRFKTFEEKIQKALKGTKNIKQGNKYVGKYTRDVNAVFEELRHFNNLLREQARRQLENINLFEGEETDDLSFEDKLKRKFLYYKATPSQYVSNDLMSNLYQDIITLKSWGYLNKQREKLLNKIDIDAKVDNLLKVLDKKKKSGPILSGYVQALGNWESGINAIFNEKVKNEYSLLDAEANVQIWINKQKQDFINNALKIFNVNKYQFDNLIIDKLSEKYKFVEYGTKRTHNVELNKMNIILAYIWNKNDVLHERLTNQFGEDGLNEMFSKLDNQEIEFANLLQQTAEKFYNDANKVYIRKYGIELPKVKNYFPSKTERTSVIDLLSDFSLQSSSCPSFIKNRINSSLPIMKFSNPLTTLFGHIDKMGVFINMTDTVDTYNKVFTNTDLKKSIIEKYGENTYKALIQMLGNSSYQKMGTNIDTINSIFNKLVNNFVSANIILKPSIMIKQLLSCVNYAENMPVSVWTKGLISAVSNPKQTIEFMMQDEYLKTRFETGGQSEYLQSVIEHSRFAKTRKFIDYLSLNVKIGDIGAIIFGGKPYVDYLMKTKGMTKENAFREFRLSTLRSQQASMASSLSNFQNNYNNPWVRGLFSFRNTPNQYFRKVADAFVSYKNGDITAYQCGKNVFIYTFLNAFLYNTATSLSLVALAFGGGDDDDDLKKDFIKSVFDFNSQAIPIIGDIYSYILDRLMGAKRKGDVSIPSVTDLFDVVSTITSDDVTFEDYFECMAILADDLTGLPVQSAANMTGGAIDVVTGKPESGVLRTLGYTKKRSEKVTGENSK